jgi:hypothetical protein
MPSSERDFRLPTNAHFPGLGNQRMAPTSNPRSSGSGGQASTRSTWNRQFICLQMPPMAQIGGQKCPYPNPPKTSPCRCVASPIHAPDYLRHPQSADETAFSGSTVWRASLEYRPGLRGDVPAAFYRIPWNSPTGRNARMSSLRARTRRPSRTMRPISARGLRSRWTVACSDVRIHVPNGPVPNRWQPVFQEAAMRFLSRKMSTSEEGALSDLLGLAVVAVGCLTPFPGDGRGGGSRGSRSGAPSCPCGGRWRR